MYYTYVLYSPGFQEFYVGFTSNLRLRIKQHFSGDVLSTRKKRPLNLVYYEVCYNSQEAKRRELYLKTSYGKRYVKNRLRDYFNYFR